MEEVLDIYERDYDSQNPVLCFDERPSQLIGDVVMPIAMKTGKVQRRDHHYKRNGTCCVMMAVEPLAGKRIVEVRKRRTKKDYALFMKKVEREYPKAKKIILVQDNLNTHCPASLYCAFTPSEARRLVQRFEWHFTPKHGSSASIFSPLR